MFRATHSVSSPGLSAQVGFTRLAPRVDCATRQSPSCGAIPMGVALPCLGNRDGRDTSAFTRVFRRAMPGHDTECVVRPERDVRWSGAAMKICRFNDDRLGIVVDGVVHDVTDLQTEI